MIIRIWKRILCLAVASMLGLPISVSADSLSGNVLTEKECVNYNSIDVTLDSSLLNQIQPQDIQKITTENPDSNEINVVDEAKLKATDLLQSDQIPLYIYKNGKLIRFTIDHSYANQFTVAETRALIDETDGDAIHIYEVGATAEVVPTPHNASTKATGYYVRTGEAKKSGSQYVKKDVFAGSVAKGESKKITYTGSLEFSVTSAESSYYSKSQLKYGLKAKITCSFTRTLNSNNMKSGCNCREFRVKYYAQKYTRTQKKIDAKRGTQIGATRTATVSEPTKYLSYSIDKRV